MSKIARLKDLWQKIVFWNSLFFPAIALTFVSLAVLEDFNPGFLGFFFNPLWLFGITVLSALLYFFAPAPAQIATKEPPAKNAKIRLLVLGLLLALIPPIILWRTAPRGVAFKIVVIAFAMSALAIFGFNVLFPAAEERKRLLKPFKRQGLLKEALKLLAFTLLTAAILIAATWLYYAVFDPFALEKFFTF